MNKLNKQFFETKKKYKEGLKKRKLTFKRAAINLIITFSLIWVVSILQKSCEQRIEENKLKELQKESNKKIDKSLLNGVWAENIDDNAMFYIENDSIHYFDSIDQPAYPIDLSGDILSIYYDGITFRWKVLKLSNDSLVYESEKNKIKLYKRK
ncbi:MAG: hypothetical protein COA88_02965 [Kordia sp.]|nr:MAG: hypothetical protein COA88_02965 [Kordia sp.]